MKPSQPSPPSSISFEKSFGEVGTKWRGAEVILSLNIMSQHHQHFVPCIPIPSPKLNQLLKFYVKENIREDFNKRVATKYQKELLDNNSNRTPDSKSPLTLMRRLQ